MGARADPMRTAPNARGPTQSAGGALASRTVFYSRIRRASTFALALVAVTLAIGMVGYHVLERMTWLDAFHQSALLLSGVGSAVEVMSPGGKVFDGIYAHVAARQTNINTRFAVPGGGGGLRTDHRAFG